MSSPSPPPSGEREGDGAPPAVPSVSSLLRSTLVYGAGSVLNRVVTFLLLPVLTRFLDPAEYGVSALLDVVCALAVSVFSLGLGSSLTVCYHDTREPAGRQRAVATAFVLQLVSCLTLLALAGLGPSALGRFILGDAAHGRLVFLGVLTASTMILQQPLSMRLQFEGRATRLVSLNLISTVLLVVCSLVGVVGLGRGVTGLWEGRLVAHALTLAMFLAHFPWRRVAGIRRGVAVELLRLGLPMIPSFAAIFVLLQANRYILSWFAGLDTVGVYSVGVQLGMAMGLAVSAFTTAWTPFFMAFVDRRAAAPAAFSRVTTFYVLGFGAMSLLFYAAARPALMILTAPAFHQGFRVAGFAATAQFMIGVFNLLTPAGTFARELKSIGLVQVGAALLALALNLALIPWLGLTGAGLALAGGPCLMAALLWAWNLRRGERYLQVPYDRRRFAVFAGFYVVAAAALTRPRAWELGVEVVVASVALGVIAVVVWRLIAPDERATLLSWCRGLLGWHDTAHAPIRPRETSDG